MCYIQYETYRVNFGRELHRETECPFSSISDYGRVWRKDAGKPGLKCVCLSARWTGHRKTFPDFMHGVKLACNLTRACKCMWFEMDIEDENFNNVYYIDSWMKRVKAVYDAFQVSQFCHADECFVWLKVFLFCCASERRVLLKSFCFLSANYDGEFFYVL